MLDKIAEVEQQIRGKKNSSLSLQILEEDVISFLLAWLFFLQCVDPHHY
jgi:hypothetical protein